MTFDRPYYYVTWGGGLINGHEQWQTGFKCAPLSKTVPLDSYQVAMTHISVQDIWNLAAKSIEDKTAFPLMKFTTAQSVEWAKVALIGTNGLYAGEPLVWEEQRKGPDPIGTADAPQVTPVVSLWAGKTLGRANRGRMYVPCPYNWNNQLDPFTGQLPSANTNQLASQYSILLKEMNGEVSTVEVPTRPVIMSSLGSGTTNEVAKVGAGRILDTHRSRRRSLDDTVQQWYTVL